MPLHHQPAYAAEHAARDLPATELASREVLSLPIHPLLGEAELERVVAAVRAAS
jgi:dTDP-4-amino-4,6-dideoxygalactose transaminase